MAHWHGVGYPVDHDDASPDTKMCCIFVPLCVLAGSPQLKPENMLLSSTHSDAALKIADFGISKVVQPGRRMRETAGSPMYVAPEVMVFCSAHFALDVQACCTPVLAS